jgi:hypothetical protein
VTAAAQVLYTPLVLVRPTRMVLLLGIWGNLTIVVPYLLIRMVGIPLFGPGAGIGRGDRLRRLVRYSFGGRDRCGTGGGAVTGNHSQKETHDPALRGRRVGLGRARGAPGVACLLNLGSRVRASAPAGQSSNTNILDHPFPDVG